MTDLDDQRRAAVATVLRRTGFGPHPGQVDALLDGGPAAAAEAALAAAPLDAGRPSSLRAGDDAPVRWWLARMADPAAWLHERLVWHWHGLLTSANDKVDDWGLMVAQHLLLRRHAAGNFRRMLQEVTVDPAMLSFLDGDGSTADAPNENYAREVMELFALGRGAYTQADVRAGAVAFSGWTVDPKTRRAGYDSGSGPTAAVQLLGRTVASASEAVDAICDHPACARHVAAKVHTWLVGAPPTPERLEVLAGSFRADGLEVAPLVAEVVRDPALATSPPRPRTSLEWVVAAAVAVGVASDAGALRDGCQNLAQVPFDPPNVGGWPPGLRWLGGSYAAGKAATVLGWLDNPAARGPDGIAAATDPVAAVIDRCALWGASAPTRAALDEGARRLWADRTIDDRRRAGLLLALGVTTPEFSLA